VTKDPGEVARRWLSAFNAGDVEALLELYAEDAVHESPKVRMAMRGGDGKLRGKTALREWWQGAFSRLPGMTYELTALTSDPSRAVIEYIRRAPGEEPLAVAEAFEVRDGKIVHSIVYHF
jgi:ketosteroid isomerase-like protein